MKPKINSRRRDSKASQDPSQYTPFYAYKPAGVSPSQKALYCEGASLERVAQQAGTPTYVYSRGSIEEAYQRLDGAFSSLPHTICYAVKANSNLSVLRLLARLGSSFDIVSGGELDRLRRRSGKRLANNYFKNLRSYT